LHPQLPDSLLVALPLAQPGLSQSLMTVCHGILSAPT
jgi:hypothetical protein